MQSNTNEGRNIIRCLSIRGTPQRVFQALTRPEELPTWFCDGATFEPKVGGKLELRWHLGMDKPEISELTVQELVPDKKLVLKAEKRSFFPNTTLTFELKPEGERTTLNFRQEGFQPDF